MALYAHCMGDRVIQVSTASPPPGLEILVRLAADGVTLVEIDSDLADEIRREPERYRVAGGAIVKRA